MPPQALRELPWEDVEQRLDHDSESSQRIRQAAEELATDTSALFWSFTQTDLYGDMKTPQGVFWTNMIELYTEPDSSALLLLWTCLDPNRAPNARSSPPRCI